MEQKYIQEDEITLKELIEKIRDYFFVILKNWIIVLLISLIVGGLFYFRESIKPEKYTADLTFTLIENESVRMPGSSVFDLIGFSVGSNANVNKILETVRSSIFVKLFLFQEMEYNGKTDYIANHLIRVEKMNEGWIKNELIENEFYYENLDTVFSLFEDRIFKNLCGFLIYSEKNPALRSSFNEDNEIIKISFQSKEAEFAVEFCNVHFDYLSDYFLDNMIFEQQETIDIIKNRRDSFKTELVSREYQLANFYDSYRNTILKQDKLPQLRLERDIQMLQAAYAQTAQNYEIALFNKENSQPIIQAMDRPFLPLKFESQVLKQTIIGLFFGFFISVFFIVFRKIIQDAMA